MNFVLNLHRISLLFLSSSLFSESLPDEYCLPKQKCSKKNKKTTLLFFPIMWLVPWDHRAPNDCHGKQITLDYTCILFLTYTYMRAHTKIYTIYTLNTCKMTLALHVRCKHNNTRCYGRYRSLSGAINSHSDLMNNSVNTVFWSSILKSMKLLINP